MEIIVTKETGMFFECQQLTGDLSNPDYYVSYKDITEDEQKEIRRFLMKLTKIYNKALSRIDERDHYDTGRCKYFRKGVFDPLNSRLPWICCGLYCSGKGMTAGNLDSEGTSTWWANGFRRINGKLVISRLFVSATYGSTQQKYLIEKDKNHPDVKRLCMPQEFFSVAELVPMSDEILLEFKEVLNTYVDKYVEFYNKFRNR